MCAPSRRSRSVNEILFQIFGESVHGYPYLRHGVAYAYRDDAVFRGTIYSGSLYFAKDCTVYGVSTIQTEQGSGSSVSFEEYVTEEQPYVEAQMDGTITGFEAGNRGDFIYIQGIPVFDPATGLIVEYQEIHIP